MRMPVTYELRYGQHNIGNDTYVFGWTWALYQNNIEIVQSNFHTTCQEALNELTELLESLGASISTMTERYPDLRRRLTREYDQCD